MRFGQIKLNLAIYKLEKLEREVVEFLADRSKDGVDGSFDGFNSGSQRTGVFFRVFVESGEAYDHVNSSHLDEINVFKLLVVLQNLFNITRKLHRYN